MGSLTDRLIDARRVHPISVLRLIEGLRRLDIEWFNEGKEGSPLTKERWTRLFRFLVLNLNVEAIQLLLECSEFTPVRLLVELIEEDVSLGKDMPLCGPCFFIAGVMPCLAKVLGKEGGDKGLIGLLEGIRACPDFRSDELVSMILSLSDNYMMAPPESVLRLLFALVEERLDAPSRARAAIGLLEILRVKRKITAEQFACLMNWAGSRPDNLGFQLKVWTHWLEHGERPPEPNDWIAALGCAKAIGHEVDTFAIAVLALRKHYSRDRNPPQEVVSFAVLALIGSGQRTLVDVFSRVRDPDAVGQALVKTIDPSLAKLIASSGADNIVECLMWLAQADPQRWSELEAMFKGAVIRPGGGLILTRLAAQLARLQCSCDAVWVTLIQWAEQLPEPDRQAARAAIGLVLFSAGHELAKPWCGVPVPAQWIDGDLAGALRIGRARDWLDWMIRIELAPGVLAGIWRTALMLAFKHGELLVSSAAVVQQAQAALAKQFGTVHWDALVHRTPGARRKPLRRQLCTAPALGHALATWFEALGALVVAMVDRQGIDAAQLRPHLLFLVALRGPVAVPRIGSLLPSLEPLFGSMGEAAPLTRAKLARLVKGLPHAPVRKPLGSLGPSPLVDAWQIDPDLDAHLSALIGLAASAGIDKGLVQAFHQAHGELTKLVTAQEFHSQFQLIEFFSIEVLDKSDVSMVFLFGDEDPPPQWAAGALTQLAGPCTTLFVRDESAALVAVFDCPLVMCKGLDRPSLLCADLRWTGRWTYSPTEASAPRLAALGPELASLLRSLAGLLDITEILLGPNCFFSAPGRPKSKRQLVALADIAPWRELVKLPGVPEALPQDHEVIVLPLKPQ